MQRKFKNLITIFSFFSFVGLQASISWSVESKLTYTGWLGGFAAFKKPIQKMETEFERQNPGIDLVRSEVPYPNALNQARVSTIGGNAPDVMLLSPGWIADIQAIGGLEPLNDYFTENEWNKIPKSLRDAVTIDGKIYALAWHLGPILLYYNRNLLKQAGFNPDVPPQTWPELKKVALKICNLPPDGGAKIYGVALRTVRSPNSAQWAIPIIYGHGGGFYENGKVKTNTEANRKAFKWLQDVVQAGCSPEGFATAETRTAFSNGHAGFIFEGPWGRGLIQNMSGKKLKVSPEGDVWVSHMPKDPSGKWRTVGNGNQIVISSQAKDKHLAAKFIKFVTHDPKFTDMFFKGTVLIPTPNIDLLTSGAMGADEHTQIFVQALDHTNDTPIKHPKMVAVLDKLAPAMQAIMKGANIEEELKKLDKKIDRLLSQ